MPPGLYDNPKTQRREMWLADLYGKPIFYGWCHRDALPRADARWDPTYPFGYFEMPK